MGKNNDEVSVSVIIPVYNVEKYLEDCLDSVLGQNFNSYEIICINDASTDSSLEILEKYAEIYSNIHIVKCMKNKGLSAARNLGMDIAVGKYVLFLDSDDMITSEALYELYFCAEKNNLDEIYFNMQHIYEDGVEEYVEQDEIEYKEYLDVYSGQEMFCKFQKDNIYKVTAWRQFFNREFLIKNNLKFYEGILHEDMLFSFLCAMKAERVMNINKDYYIYRKRNGSIMAIMDKRRAESMYIVLMELFKFWDSQEFLPVVEEAISAYFENIYNAFKWYKSYCADFDITIGSNAEKKFYKLITSEYDKETDFLSGEKIKELQSVENIIVYGAGRIAGKVISTLKKHNIDILGVAVSCKKMNPRQICEIKVQEIAEFVSYKKNSLVIVAVGSKFHREIKIVLNEYEFENIMFIEK